MRTVVRIALVLMATALAGVFVWFLLSSASSDELVGKAAPAIQGIDADGAAFRLSDSLGKVVLLDFWGNW